MFENGIGINLVNAKEIQNVLQNELTSEISTILDKLTSDKFSELSTVPKNSKLSIGSLVCIKINFNLYLNSINYDTFSILL